jgi:hypothetical protein
VVPLRSPLLDVTKFVSAWDASELAHSKTSHGNSCRHVSPRDPSSLRGESSEVPFFQALNSFMKANFDHESEGVNGFDRASMLGSASLSASRF